LLATIDARERGASSAGIPRCTVLAQHRGEPSPSPSHMTTVAVRVDVNAQPRTAVAVRSAPS
jgi:hypothetical protein